MQAPYSISCLVCAFNEEKTISHVLEALRGVTEVSEVIVVDDGSRDGTAEVVRKYPFCRLVSLPENKGKSFALAHGLSLASHPYIMTLDADLMGLQAENIRALIAPVFSGISEVTISLRKNSVLIYKLIGLDFVSGERVFPRTLIADKLDVIRTLPRFGFETYLNTLIIGKRLSIRVVYWNNVLNKLKIYKIGFWPGVRAELVMVREIFRTLSLPLIIMQNYRLLRLMRITPTSPQ